MGTTIRDFVMNHALFSHHDHHRDFKAFDDDRENYSFESLLGSLFRYAGVDIGTAAGTKSAEATEAGTWWATQWPMIRTTGYGRAVSLGCKTLFELDYTSENFGAITAALRSALKGKSASDVYNYFLTDKANNKWVIQDGHFHPGREDMLREDMYPDYYRFAWRMDNLFAIVDAGPITTLESATGIEVLSLDHLVKAMNANIDTFKATGKLAAFKVGIAYQRDLVITDATRHDAERAFIRIRNRKTFHDGIQQNSGAVNAREARPLADYLFHRLMQRASDEDMPVQIHTGFLAGCWGSLAGTKALHLIPVFERYRHVRFDIFHASWPWTSELGAIAKNYPNVYPDMCWVWSMNPTESERTLAEWLDGIPFNKIFAYGADTGLPWCNVGYSFQARLGIARVLEQKIQAGYFSGSTAEEVASAIMLRNGEEFYGLG